MKRAAVLLALFVVAAALVGAGTLVMVGLYVAALLVLVSAARVR